MSPFAAALLLGALSSGDAEELLARFLARLAECRTFHAVGVEHEEWYAEGELWYRKEHSFELAFERPDRLALTTRTLDGVRDGDSERVVHEPHGLKWWRGDQESPSGFPGDPWITDAGGLELVTRLGNWRHPLAPHDPLGDPGRQPPRLAETNSGTGGTLLLREPIDGVDSWRLALDSAGVPWTLWIATADLRPVRIESRAPGAFDWEVRRRVEFRAAFDAPVPADAFALTRPLPTRRMGPLGHWNLVKRTLLASILLAVSVCWWRRVLAPEARGFDPTEPCDRGLQRAKVWWIGGLFFIGREENPLMAAAGWQVFDLGQAIFTTLAIAGLFGVLWLRRRGDAREAAAPVVQSGLRGVDPIDAERRIEAVAAARGLRPVRQGAKLLLEGVAQPVRYQRGSSTELQVCHPSETTELVRSLLQETAAAINAAGGARVAKFERLVAVAAAVVALACVALELAPP